MNKTEFKVNAPLLSANRGSSLEEPYVNNYSDKSVSTFYYIAIRNHVDLGNLADKKSNLLLSVNALIFSILISNIIIQFSEVKLDIYLIPIALIIITNISTIILCVLTTRPNISSGEFAKDDMLNKNVNLAFFGNFYKMKQEDYETAVRSMVGEKEFIHSVLSKDLYFLGAVLHKKYVMLNYTYLLFSTGLLSAIVAVVYLAISN